MARRPTARRPGAPAARRTALDDRGAGRFAIRSGLGLALGLGLLTPGGARAAGPAEAALAAGDPGGRDGRDGLGRPDGASRAGGPGEPDGGDGAEGALQRSRRLGRWLLDHLVTDMAVVGGWRASFADDARAGFLAQALGAELSLGLEFGDGYAVVGGARALAGTSNTTSSPQGRAVYLEALGHLGFQLRVTGLLRLGLGATSGLLRRWPQDMGDAGAAQDAVLLGGYLRAAVDFLPRQSATLLRAFSLFMRMDIGGPIAAAEPPAGALGDPLPRTSLGLSLGLGLRL